MKTLRFGIIGCGLMGHEFASAAARWCQFTEADARPEIVAVCNRSLRPERIDWFKDNFTSIRQITSDYRELLANPDVDAVYVAVPHNFHKEIYCAAVEAGKHLLGEKPFGIDLAANEAILKSIKANPASRAGCASQYIYYPAVQRVLKMIDERIFGRIIEVEAGFLHSSDLNPNKPINWKRTIEANGEYGVMGDLGPHIALVLFRAGWLVENTTAICSKIVARRPDSSGKLVPCDTWDNVTMLCELHDPKDDTTFPLRMRLARIMPGEMNTWYLEIYGTKASARFSLKNPRLLEFLQYTGGELPGGEQAWESIEMGFETAYKTITGGIFEFGALDAFSQMTAAFMYEISHGRALGNAAKCPTPEEMHGCHRLFTAALQSQEKADTVRMGQL